MTSLKTLTFKTIERNRRASEIIARRQKLIVKLEEQQKVLEHHMKGEQYVVTGPKWMRNNHGERVLVQKPLDQSKNRTFAYIAIRSSRNK